MARNTTFNGRPVSYSEAFGELTDRVTDASSYQVDRDLSVNCVIDIIFVPYIISKKGKIMNCTGIVNNVVYTYMCISHIIDVVVTNNLLC